MTIEIFKLDRKGNKTKIKTIDLNNYSKIYSGNNLKLIHKNGGRPTILWQTSLYGDSLHCQKSNDESVKNRCHSIFIDKDGNKIKRYVETEDCMSKALKVTYTDNFHKVNIFGIEKNILIKSAEVYI